MASFVTKSGKEIAADALAVVLRMAEDGFASRDISIMIKTGGIFAASKYAADVLKPMVRNVVSPLQSVLGRAFEFVFEVVLTTAVQYIIYEYGMGIRYDWKKEIFWVMSTSSMADTLEKIVL